LLNIYRLTLHNTVVALQWPQWSDTDAVIPGGNGAHV